MPGIVFQNRVWLMFVGFVVIVALRLRSVTPTTQTKVNDEMHDADLTVLVTDFEEWANNAGDTVRSICEALPGSRVVIVGRDRSPYPDPLSKTRLHRALPPGCSVLRTGLGFVPGAAISDNDLFQGRRYVLLVSGSVLFNAATGWAAVRSLHYESVRLGGIAAKVIDSEAQGSCVRGMLSIKYWTLSLTPGDSKGLGCNYPADQNSAVVMYATAAIFERLQWRVMQEDVARGLLLQAMAVGDDVPVMMQQLPTPNKMSNRGIRLNPVSPFDSPHRIEKSNRLKGVRYERLLSRFGIKLIESVTGKEWHGCLRNTPRCFGTIEDDIPDYLQENKYTPPCCLAKLRETTRYAFAVLDQAGARFWLEGGSLLGAARGGDIIPWDYDVVCGITFSSHPLLIRALGLFFTAIPRASSEE